MRNHITGRLATTATLLTLAACGASTAAVGNNGGTPSTATAPPLSTQHATSSPQPTTSKPVAANPVTPYSRPPAPRHTATPAPPAPPAPHTMTIVTSAATSMGRAVVASSNGKTLYTFNSDTAGSGMTTCNGGCASEWPPLTVAAGTAPTAGPGVTGHLGTIKRSDGSTQVTDNGLALYFFAGDSGPAQTNGVYPGWSLARA